jgi:hypothetical protein
MKKIILLFVTSAILMFSCLFFMANFSLANALFVSIGASFLTYIVASFKKKRLIEAIKLIVHQVWENLFNPSLNMFSSNNRSKSNLSTIGIV